MFNFSFVISLAIPEMLKECYSRVIEETEIKTLLSKAFNTTDEGFLTNAVNFIIYSIILGQVRKNIE